MRKKKTKEESEKSSKFKCFPQQFALKKRDTRENSSKKRTKKKQRR